MYKVLCSDEIPLFLMFCFLIGRIPASRSRPSAGTELYRPAARTSAREHHHYQQRRMSFLWHQSSAEQFRV